MQDLECEHCGGTNFYKEAGYFYCKGCQIQSQEVQEYVYAGDLAADDRLTTKQARREKKKKVDHKITSWECYNYILLGLTEELINLGADKRLKSVVKILWLRYVEKLQVIKLGEDRLPKLQVVCSAIDAEVVYGKPAKKKRKRRASSSSDTTLEASSIKQERIKKRRALIKAQYEDFSQKSQDASSLQNETLASLKSSDQSSKKSAVISYNIYASRECKRIRRSKYHFYEHTRDFLNHMNCHKLTYKNISHKYRESPHILSLNKIYSILYLGLLIIKDKIQLGDMLRFIKEGHLSFNCYSHFFPEDFEDKTLNFRNFKKNSLFATNPFRVITSEMSVFLDIEHYLPLPDLVELSERYCKELNLPQEICDCVKVILSKSGIRMSFRKRFKKVPNYEGRVLSIIIFVMKLLFGLDDVTEFHLGKFSDTLNRSRLINPKMFNVIDWLKHIEYRDLVLTNKHFPSGFSKDLDVKNVAVVLDTLGKKEYPETKLSADQDYYKQLLLKLKETVGQPESTEFPVTFTPFADYAKLLPKPDFLEILFKDFRNEKITHILQSSKFLEIFNPKIVHGGANDNWIMEKVISCRKDRRLEARLSRKLMTVKLSFDSSSKTEKKPSEETKGTIHKAPESEFCSSSSEDLDLEKIRKELQVSSKDYPKHYEPDQRFWIRTKLQIEALNHKECRKYLEEFPCNFRLLFRECQRIAQQSESELLAEYQMTELCLVNLVIYDGKPRTEIIRNKLVVHYLSKYIEMW